MLSSSVRDTKATERAAAHLLYAYETRVTGALGAGENTNNLCSVCPRYVRGGLDKTNLAMSSRAGRETSGFSWLSLAIFFLFLDSFLSFLVHPPCLADSQPHYVFLEAVSTCVIG